MDASVPSGNEIFALCLAQLVRAGGAPSRLPALPLVVLVLTHHARWCRGGGVGALKFLKLREEEWRTIQPAKHTIRFDATPDDSTVIELPRTPGSWSVLAYPELPLPAGTVDAVSLV